MYTGIYDYDRVNVIKIILENQDGKILLIQEPKNNNWMPLHWGLPGGKPTKNESLSETLIRKIQNDIGNDVEIDGVVEIEEILMKERTIFMYIVKAKTRTDKISGEINDFKWVSKEDVGKLEISDFTEFYNKRLLSDYFDGKLSNPIPLEIIKTGEHYKLETDPEYINWINSGSRK